MKRPGPRRRMKAAMAANKAVQEVVESVTRLVSSNILVQNKVGRSNFTLND